MKLAHIINPVAVSTSSDLYVAQPITFRTMETARGFALGQVDVRLFCAQYDEDRSVVPEWITMTRDLDRSVLDTDSFVVDRKLPLLGDILDRLYEASDADYYVYSNVDIGLLPSFYLAVDRLAAKGYDAFVITRRTIGADYAHLDDIPLMQAEVGSEHPGYDCFIYRRHAYPEFYLGSVCIGANWVGKALMMNLMCTSERFGIFRDLHLTFHLGDDRAWTRHELQDYTSHNERELHKVLRHFDAATRFADHEEYRNHIDDMSRGRLTTDAEPLARRMRRWAARRLGRVA